MKIDSVAVMAGAIVLAALLVAVGFGFQGLQQQENSFKAMSLELPSYLEKDTGYSGSVGSYGADMALFSDADSDSRLRLLSVTGQVTKSVAPDEAEITLAVETVDKSAKKSQADNAVLAERVMDALKSAGVAEEDIKTVSYNLREETRWNDSLRKYEPVGYRTSNSIMVTVKNLDATGNIIDAAVNAGVNRVSSVRFTLSRQKTVELRTLALKEAAQNAREKADSIASGLGVSLFQVHSASESSGYSYSNYSRSYDMMESLDASDGASTPITPGDIDFSATVNVQFEIR
jgi:uncharacterized protein